MTAELTRQLRGDEGEKLYAYQDSLSYLTIGVGRLIDQRKGGGISKEESAYLLANDIAAKTAELIKSLPWLYLLDPVRQGALVNMAFQLGVAGLLGFRNSLELMRTGQYREAADNFLKSKWANQTPNRARRITDQIRTGVWVYAEGA
jgi:lysozyme